MLRLVISLLLGSAVALVPLPTVQRAVMPAVQSQSTAVARFASPLMAAKAAKKCALAAHTTSMLAGA